MSLLVVMASALAGVSAKPVAVAVNAASPPVLDGVLDDAVWGSAPVSDSFTQKLPADGAAPSEATRVRVVYDRENLYIGIECEQKQSRIISRLSRRDREVESDRVVVAVDSIGSGTGAFEFGVNVAGVLVDSIRFNDTEQSFDWDENWEARTAVGEGKWMAEFKIPFRVLRFSDIKEHSFGFQVRRYLSERQEVHEWAYTPRTVAGEVSQYGRLNGIELDKQPSAVEFRPVLVGKVLHADATDTATKAGYDWKLSPGVDVKWHVAQDMTVTATLNPDFGQVEVDQRVLNLTTFETYYPEKRPFFLEGIDVFSSPLQLVYTRRVGRESSSPSLRRDDMGTPIEEGRDIVEPTTIYGAAKLTGRFGGCWTVGALHAITAANDVEVRGLDASPTPGRVEDRRVEPLSLFNVLRLKRDVGKNASVGLLATGTIRLESDTGVPSTPDGAMTWCPDGTAVPRGERCTFNAYVAGLDARWRSDDGDYSASAQAIASLLSEGYERSVPDGTTIRSGDTGLGATATVAKDGGRWTGSLWGEYDSPRLDYNDLGYMQRANFIGGGLTIDYRMPEPVGPTLDSRITLGSYIGYNTHGIPVGSGLGLGYFPRFKNFWSVSAIMRADFAYFDDRELDDGQGTALERPGGFGYDVVVNSPPTERVSFSLGSRGLRYSEGYGVTARGSMLVHVVPQWDLELVPTASFTGRQPRFTYSYDADGNPIFGRLKAQSLSAVLRSTYTFSPTLTLQTYAQLFLSSERYSDFSTATVSGRDSRVGLDDLRYGAAAPDENPDAEGGVVDFNVILRWEYRLGSLFYLTYSRSQTPNDATLQQGEHATLNHSALLKAPSVDTISVKLSYLWI